MELCSTSLLRETEWLGGLDKGHTKIMMLALLVYWGVVGKEIAANPVTRQLSDEP
jgi:hypothetical protein